MLQTLLISPIFLLKFRKCSLFFFKKKKKKKKKNVKIQKIKIKNAVEVLDLLLL
jgi:hypothetical protein